MRQYTIYNVLTYFKKNFLVVWIISLGWSFCIISLHLEENDFISYVPQQLQVDMDIYRQHHTCTYIMYMYMYINDYWSKNIILDMHMYIRIMACCEQIVLGNCIIKICILFLSFIFFFLASSNHACIISCRQ